MFSKIMIASLDGLDTLLNAQAMGAPKAASLSFAYTRCRLSSSNYEGICILVCAALLAQLPLLLYPLGNEPRAKHLQFSHLHTWQFSPAQQLCPIISQTGLPFRPHTRRRKGGRQFVVDATDQVFVRAP
jgi:hypothetical protein